MKDDRSDFTRSCITRGIVAGPIIFSWHPREFGGCRSPTVLVESSFEAYHVEVEPTTEHEPVLCHVKDAFAILASTWLYHSSKITTKTANTEFG